MALLRRRQGRASHQQMIQEIEQLIRGIKNAVESIKASNKERNEFFEREKEKFEEIARQHDINPVYLWEKIKSLGDLRDLVIKLYRIERIFVKRLTILKNLETDLLGKLQALRDYLLPENIDIERQVDEIKDLISKQVLVKEKAPGYKFVERKDMGILQLIVICYNVEYYYDDAYQSMIQALSEKEQKFIAQDRFKTVTRGEKKLDESISWENHFVLLLEWKINNQERLVSRLIVLVRLWVRRNILRQRKEPGTKRLDRGYKQYDADSQLKQSRDEAIEEVYSLLSEEKYDEALEKVKELKSSGKLDTETYKALCGGLIIRRGGLIKWIQKGELKKAKEALSKDEYIKILGPAIDKFRKFIEDKAQEWIQIKHSQICEIAEELRTSGADAALEKLDEYKKSKYFDKITIFLITKLVEYIKKDMLKHARTLMDSPITKEDFGEDNIYKFLIVINEEERKAWLERLRAQLEKSKGKPIGKRFATINLVPGLSEDEKRWLMESLEGKKSEAVPSPAESISYVNIIIELLQRNALDAALDRLNEYRTSNQIDKLTHWLMTRIIECIKSGRFKEARAYLTWPLAKGKLGADNIEKVLIVIDEREQGPRRDLDRFLQALKTYRMTQLEGIMLEIERSGIFEDETLRFLWDITHYMYNNDRPDFLPTLIQKRSEWTSGYLRDFLENIIKVFEFYVNFNIEPRAATREDIGVASGTRIRVFLMINGGSPSFHIFGRIHDPTGDVQDLEFDTDNQSFNFSLIPVVIGRYLIDIEIICSDGTAIFDGLTYYVRPSGEEPSDESSGVPNAPRISASKGADLLREIKEGHHG